jgi:o-succinylbenzoate synthase
VKPDRVLAGELEIRPYRLRLAQPLRTARGSTEFREGFVVLAHQGGYTGRGEAAPLPELGTETLAECLQELRAASLDAPPRTPAARCAVEQAFLDLVSQREGIPLARLLDPGAVLEVPASALLAAQGMPELARETRRALDEGFRTLKLKVGLDDDFARAAVVRDAAGPSVNLRLDANGAWSFAEAVRRLRELAPLGIELCEQPTEDLAGLREASPVPIAADELVARDPEAALARAHAIVLKPMLLGGLLPALRLGRRARELGLQVIVTSSLEGAIGRAGAAHLAAALLALGPQPAAGLATGRLLADDLCPDALAPRRGVIYLLESAGLGLS